MYLCLAGSILKMSSSGVPRGGYSRLILWWLLLALAESQPACLWGEGDRCVC